MSIQLENLYGIYEMVDLVATENHKPSEERKNAGCFVFMRDNTLSVVSGSTTMVMAYTGPFELIDGTLNIQIQACTKREREGTVLKRKVLSLDGDVLVMDAGNDGNGISAVITWKRKVRL